MEPALPIVQGLSRRASSSLAGSITARRLARSNTFAANESTLLNSLEAWVEQGPHDAERLRAAAAKLTELSDKAQLKATEVEAAATAVAAAVAATNEMEAEPPVPPVVDDTTAAIDAELTIASRPSVAVAAAREVDQILSEAADAPLATFGVAVDRLIDEHLAPVAQAYAKEFLEGPASAMPAARMVAAVAALVNRAYARFRDGIARVTSQSAALQAAIGEEAMAEMRLAQLIATTSHSTVTCEVEWTPPAAMEETPAVTKRMAASQREAVKCWETGSQAAEAPLAELLRVVEGELMPLYKRRVESLTSGGGSPELYATMPAVVDDLLPKARAPRPAPAMLAPRRRSGH